MPAGLTPDRVYGIQDKNRWETRAFDKCKVDKPPMLRITP